MPLTPKPVNQVPSLWRAFGHSYLQYAFGTFDQTGRLDALFSSAMDVERGGNWYNYAVNGAALSKEGNSQGGYITVFQAVTNNIGRGGPYAPTDGAALLCFGINDIGFLGTTATVRGGFQHSLRAVISRLRASTIFENDFQVGTRTTYGAGFGVVSATDFSSGAAQTVHWATALTNANFTLTLPSDYDGEPVSICFVGASGASGGTVTWTGTAGVTGTTVTGSQAAGGTHCPVIKRITNLTSANAGQTIIGTVSSLDAGGAVMLDCWWLESKSPNPIVVNNIARLTTAGYAIYGSWTGTEAQKDQNVVDFNSDIATVVAEFDSMVQIADIDSVIGKGDTKILFDGLHPTERGSARACDQMLAAWKRMDSNSADGQTANFNTPSPCSSSLKMPRRSGNMYSWNRMITTSPTSVIPTVNQELMAFPYVVTAARERYTAINMRTGTTGGGTAGQFRWGLYDDVGWTGYPQRLYAEPTVSAAKSTGTTASTTISDSVAWPLDPGLYWIAFKWTVLPLSPLIIMIAANQPPDAAWVLPPFNATMGTTAGANAPACGWALTGQGTGVLPGTFPSGATVRAVGTAAGTCAPLITLTLA
jgi:hypothetical protein